MKKTQPLFSILIPTTGREDLVRTAVMSVMNQTCRDLEIVIADISMSEEMKRTLNDFHDTRIRHIHAKDGGLSTWDIAAKAAEGKYLLWLDDDNYLLSFALDLFKNAIERSDAEIITASHFYYYDRTHPRHFLRSSLGVVPFTGKEYPVNVDTALRGLFSFSKRGARENLPRFHFSATVISRTVIERAIGRLGFLLFTDVPNIHSLQPILFAFAKSCFFIDWPVVIVGRLGVSMSQIWSTEARRRFKMVEFRPKLSPVTGYARINGILENYLKTKSALPDLLGSIPINYTRFAELYMRELFLLDTNLLTAVKNWRNLFSFLKTLPPPSQEKLFAEARRLFCITPFMYFIRRFRLHYLWRMCRGVYVNWRGRGVSSREKFAAGNEFAIRIQKEYTIDSIDSLATHIPEIIQKELGLEIYPRF